MKRIRLFTVIIAAALCINCLTVVFAVVPVQAASGTAVKTLNTNTTYKLDLNGGSKESIRIVTSWNYPYQWTLYVNEKRVYSHKGYASEVKYADLNTSDKYKELLVTWTTGASDHRVTAIRYYSKNSIKTWLSDYYRIYTKGLKNTGKNKFYLRVDTPYSNQNFGCNYVLVPQKLSGSKIKKINASSYKIADSMTYTLNKPMKLYPKATRSNAKTTLKSGTMFKALSIKPGSSKKSSYGMKWYNIFVKIKTTSGKTGWLYFPAMASGSMAYLRTIPQWG